jgi:hypothetical protein
LVQKSLGSSPSRPTNIKLYTMAGNKYNPPNRPYKPYTYTLNYINEQGSNEAVQGSAKQIMLHILNQHTK